LAWGHTERLENFCQRAETRERRLQHIGADNSREPKPAGMVDLGQPEANQNEHPGKRENSAIN
jgi:hypothetical protein